MIASEAVLVTGASTGIGKAIVEDLREKGVRVFAAVRDLSTVDEHPLVTAVRLDVTSAAEIAAAAKFVESELGDSKFRGIVNNAGVPNDGSPLEFTGIDEFRRILEVNVVAQVAVTQAFLPLLRERGPADPRVVFMGSIYSRASTPFVGPYAASKHAVLAVGETLRQELRPWGFKVSVIEPGNIATDIWSKSIDQTEAMLDSLSEHARELYADRLDLMGPVLKDADSKGIPPSAVARVARKALFDKRPRSEYLVGIDARAAAFGRRAVPAPVLDRIVASEMKRRGRG